MGGVVVWILGVVFSLANKVTPRSGGLIREASSSLPWGHADGKEVERRFTSGEGSFDGVSLPVPWRSLGPSGFAPTSSSQISCWNNPLYGLCKRSLCSASTSKATMVVDKKMGRTWEMEAVDEGGVIHRWSSWRSYGARRLPASTTSPSTLLAEGRPLLFLPALMPKGRQCSSDPVSMVSFSGACRCRSSSYGGPAIPSGVVPGDGEIATVKELVWTRSRFLFSVGGPLCKSQGLSCIFYFLLGPDVKCALMLI